jgi:Na+-transporting NADH:ubiquinone oxidoreductase subunit F
VIEKEGHIYLDLKSIEAQAEISKAFELKVLSNDNVATFIKELVLEPLNSTMELNYQPGDYLKLEIPPHRTSFRSIKVNEPYHKAWSEMNVFNYHSFSSTRSRRNYSLATNPQIEKQLKFNIRIALPPPGMNCDAGSGSSYVFSLKPGDTVKAEGPFGEFHVKETEKEMVYVGGGAGMAPLRSHISWLFDSLRTKRKVSFWYGARSIGELFYDEYFADLTGRSENFNFEVALSEPKKEDNWDSYTGIIHEVLDREFLSKQEKVTEKEYYLCGPPEMINAVQKVLAAHKVPKNQISFDEF